MTTHLWLQLVIAFVQELVSLIIIGWMNPYAMLGKWKREMVNEYFITLTIYHVMCFTDGNSALMKTFVGYSFCFFLSVHVLGNIAFIMCMALKSTYWACKKKTVIKRELKRVAKLRNDRSVNMVKTFKRNRSELVQVLD